MTVVRSYDMIDMERVLALVGQHPSYVAEVDGKRFVVDIRDVKYQVFKRQPYCAACGARGTFFFLQRERDYGKCHFNLYTASMEMLTVDHIIPLSKKGEDRLANLQTLCLPCNKRKDNRIISNEELRNESDSD